MSQGDNAKGSGLSRRGLPALDALQDEALQWLLELQASKGDAAVRQAFDAWLAKDQRHAVAFDEVSQLWNSPEFGTAVMRHERLAMARGDRADPMLRHVVATTHGKRPGAGRSSGRYWGRSVGAIAAVLILAAVMHYSGVLVYLSADYATATGQQRRVALPDGSTLLLNSGSAVALDFGTAHRRVRLIEGEAFFEVVRDPDRRFEVTAPFTKVEVTGTKFAVRAAGEGDNVTVQDGSVSVLARSGSAAAFKLLPRHAIALGAEGTGSVRTIDADIAFAWLEGRIRFNDRPLGGVLDELRRYHRGIIIVASDRINHIRVSGNYRLDDPPLIVASLAEAIGAKLTRISDYVLILH
jgi:transmembrane sensor